MVYGMHGQILNMHIIQKKDTTANYKLWQTGSSVALGGLPSLSSKAGSPSYILCAVKMKIKHMAGWPALKRTIT